MGNLGDKVNLEHDSGTHTERIKIHRFMSYEIHMHFNVNKNVYNEKRRDRVFIQNHLFHFYIFKNFIYQISFSSFHNEEVNPMHISYANII